MGSLYGIYAALSALSSCPEPENKFNRVAGQSVGSASSSAGQAFRPDQNRPGRDRAWSGLAWLDLAWACAPSSSSSSVPPARFSTRLDIAAQKLPQTNQQSDSPSLLSLCVRACRAEEFYMQQLPSLFSPFPSLPCSTLLPPSLSFSTYLQLHIWNWAFLLAGRVVASGLICCTPSAPPLLPLLLFPLSPPSVFWLRMQPNVTKTQLRFTLQAQSQSQSHLQRQRERERG